VSVGADSRIDRIQVNPAPFEPGTTSLTSEGQQQVARLTEFLGQLPEVTMALTPVVSSGDITALKRQKLESALERTVTDNKLSREAAARRLFEQRFANRPAPATPEATFAALLEQEPAPSSAVPELAARRVEVVRGAIKQGGIDPARLVEAKVAERAETSGQIEFDVRQPETPQQPSKAREVLKRLGIPLKGADARD
jgi:hypothetical protein